MSTVRPAWFSFGAPGGTALRCAECGSAIDLGVPAADHHPGACPACRAESVFLTWKGRAAQVVMKNAPPALAAAIRWTQKQLDELEFVELLCALEELSGAADGGRAARG
jgi:hypothetical protein